MKIKNVVPMSLGILTLCSLYQPEAQALPPDFAVQYNLRASPGDPSSDISHHLIIGLLENIRKSDKIGRVTAILTIHELDPKGNMIYGGSPGYPTVDTADGRCWIHHADPDNPVMAEFVLPSRFCDTAPALDIGVSDLDSDIKGNVYTEPEGGAPFNTPGSLDSFLQLADTPPPKKDENDEPLEVPDDPSHPYPS